MSDSVQPHRLQPARLPIPGILQARTPEWVAISFSNAWKWKVKLKSLSRVRLFATPLTAAHQAPPSMRFSRQEYWSGVPERCKWHLLVHLFIVTETLPREVPEPENHFIREMLGAWSLKTSPPPTSSPKHFQSDFLNLGFLFWVELWELGGKRREEKNL